MVPEQFAAAAAESRQSCPTLCDPIDGSPPGFPVPGILQARTLEWVAISFSNAWKWKVKVKSLSRVRLLATPWTTAYQAPPSMGFSRQEYWSGCHCLLCNLQLENPKWDMSHWALLWSGCTRRYGPCSFQSSEGSKEGSAWDGHHGFPCGRAGSVAENLDDSCVCRERW